MEHFDLHGLPDGFKPSVYYFLVHPTTGNTYPPKAIWGIATNHHAYDFNAQSAKRWLEKLHFYVHDTRKEPTAFILSKAVTAALKDSKVQRHSRLRTASSRASESLVLIRRFNRNPDVVAERLYLAQGHCETCGNPAPFKRASDGTPYLEVHHVIPLADGGDDTVKNTRALCPNCHRKAHHG